ncbi:putative brevis radix (BRX) domain-containing protein [Helianthus annuus]|uniref:Brevis radix (BRX) domain-containing protein n=2 Tax=Helianthus annuus TaxID=4232 RepID=A0A9K3HBK4_HELAN|nr:protein BREVIS RADIX [Helianthus annuus]XP_035837353.1 protein BREVIS RADIX [Helianthus annuus]KAF5774280.1 putative brevis radix (BRX) domain-containing protein [Helianthus annuus]KAJ0477658.1 putative brevis radix (BRX) domain, protein BREVIS RADIX [Helianthus annuus]KAJ0482187.1 putative brevis radix (BRX) domain-containing protein [Helianthus annuus]KAJ0498491.1 putative brevis radix (BRX) domain, protein BREVIS RADIX [Helianthus annuus]KAJ0664505.1 putative brevis radix (BRX) domain, 
MLTCLTCSKQQIEDEGEEVGARGNASSKEAVKGLTAQIKDALKVSGPSKGKPPIAPSSFKKGQRGYPDFETASGGPHYPYMQPGSSSSTPAWDFTNNDPHQSGGYEAPRQSGHIVLDDEDEPKEWMAQVEPGVQITFVSLPDGGNDLKRIRFNREMFNKWQAQRWWGENYDRIMELYNVQRFNCQALNTPSQSEDGRDSTYSRLSTRESPMMNPSTNKDWNRNYGGNQHYNAGPSGYGPGGPKGEMSSMEPSRTTTDSRDEPSISNASDIESEWVEQDEPGVYITIRQLIDGTRELRRVRFSREKFGEVNAKLWWEQNRERIQTQYL